MSRHLGWRVFFVLITIAGAAQSVEASLAKRKGSRWTPVRGSLTSFVICALVFLPACNAIRSPKYVAQVTIVNPFEYSFVAEVSDGQSGWLNLGGVARNSEDTTEEVIDMGNTWVFRFSFRDEDHEQLTLSRAELVGNRWRVTVPETLAKRLRARGEPPSFKA